jgi:hypothetical protein
MKTNEQPCLICRGRGWYHAAGNVVACAACNANESKKAIRVDARSAEARTVSLFGKAS